MLAQRTIAAPTEPSDEEVLRWIKEQAVSCSKWACGSFYIKWKTKRTFLPPPQAIADLAARVKGKPDHPDAGMYQTWIRRSRGEELDREVGVWMKSNIEFRWHMFRNSGDADAADEICAQHAAWKLRGGQLDIFDPSNLPDFAKPDRVLSMFQYDAAGFVYPGVMAVVQTGELQAIRVKKQSALVWEARTPSGVVLAVGYDESNSQLVVRSFRMDIGNQHDEYPPETPIHYEYSGYDSREIRNTPMYVPSVVKAYNNRGVEVFIHTLVELRAMDNDEFEKHTRVPSTASPDPVVGWSEHIHVVDWRDGWALASTSTGDVPVPKSLIESGKLRPSRGSVLEKYALKFAAVVIVGVVILSVRRWTNRS